MEVITGLLGPYGERAPDGTARVRYVLLLAGGARRSRTFASVPDAARFERAVREQVSQQPGAQLTLAVAIERYIAARSAGRWCEETVRRTRYDLASFAQPDRTPLEEVDATFVRAFLQRISHLPAGSQHKRYGSVASFLLWCWRKDLLADNPCTRIDEDEKPWLAPRYRRQHALSKPQLDVATTAVDQYIAAAVALQFADERVAALLPLLNGLRNGEVRHVRVGDIDFSRERILIRGPHLKSKHAAGSAAIAPIILEDLKRLCRGKLPGAWLFPSSDPRTPGEPRSQWWVLHQAERACAAAGVDRCTPHGLRGTYASVLGDNGRSADAIGTSLGHNPKAHGAIAKSHYMAVGEVRQSLADPAGYRTRR